MSLSLGRHGGLLVTYLRPQRRRATLLAALVLTGIALQLGVPQLVRYFIDTAQRGGPVRSLIVAGVAFLLLSLLQQGISLAALYVGQTVGWSATNGLRADLVRHTLALDMPFHREHTPGEMIERIDGDVTLLAKFFSQLTITVVGNSLLVLGILAVLFFTDWRIGLGLSLYSILTFLVLRAFHARATTRYAASRQSSAEMSGFIEERVGGTEDIRGIGAEGYVLWRLFGIMRDRLLAERNARLTSNFTFFGTNFLYVLAYTIGLAIGAYLYTHHQISLGTAYLVVFYIGMLAAPLDSIREQIQTLQQASAGIGRVDALLHTPVTLVEQVRAALPDGALDLRLDAVSFGYGEDQNVIHDLSFDLPAGRVLGVLGRTGSGKTSLTRLLVRLYDPESGAVRLGGADSRDVAFADLRRRVGMVTQDVQLIGGTIRDNLTFFSRRVPDEVLRTVLSDLGLADWLNTLPAGLDTVLEAGGGGLSAGQAQLLAFARVFLRDPGLVILDEASSRLDPATELAVERAIDRLLAGRTGVVVAHRLRTLERVDDILILEAGHIVEYGSRHALAADPTSRYARLLRTGLEEAMA